MKFIQKTKSSLAFENWKESTKPVDFDSDFLSNSPKIEEEGIIYYSKKDLKAELLQEQNNLCCYCNDEIENNHNTVLEHLLPKEGTKHQNRIFDYFNLLASCNGNQKTPKPRDLHCDTFKKYNEIDLTPLMQECETEIIYDQIGNVKGNSARAKQTITALNLNCTKLNFNRKEVIEGLIYEDIELISPKKAEKLYYALIKTKSNKFIITALQTLKQLF